MGLFNKASNAKSTQSGDYAKPGHYFIIIEGVKHSTHAGDGKEYVAFEGRYLHVLDKALWTGAVADVPKGKGGQHLLNLPGNEPKAGEPTSFVFKDGAMGNENRLKRMVLKCLDKTDDDWKKACPTEEAGVAFFKIICDPAQQILKGCVVEVKAGETTTRAKEKIVGATPLRRVYMEELRQMWEGGKLDPAAIDYLSKENRFATYATREADEKARNAAMQTAQAIAR